MVLFLPASVESCGGGHWISSREEEACPCSPQKERMMTKVTFLLSSVEGCEGGYGIRHHVLEKRGSALVVRGRRGRRAWPPSSFLGKDLWRCSLNIL